jgi:competence protein ComGF
MQALAYQNRFQFSSISRISLSPRTVQLFFLSLSAEVMLDIIKLPKENRLHVKAWEIS